MIEIKLPFINNKNFTSIKLSLELQNMSANNWLIGYSSNTWGTDGSQKYYWLMLNIGISLVPIALSDETVCILLHGGPIVVLPKDLIR